MERRRRFIVLCAAAAAFVLLGTMCCNWNPFDDTDPTPLEYPYHYHPAILRIHAVNWDSEPVGVENVAMVCGGANAERPGWGFTVSYDSSPNFTLCRGDTSTTTCTTRVRHFTGYQRKHDGDTTHFAGLDANPNWVCRLALGGEHATVPDGKSTIVRPASLCEVGDTVFPGTPWILEVELDMSGLFTRDTGDMWDELVMHPEYTHGRQVRQ